MINVENEVFKVRFKKALPDGSIVLSLRVRGNTKWIFVNDVVLCEGDSLTFCDGQEEDLGQGVFEQFPRETWTEAIKDGTLDV